MTQNQLKREIIIKFLETFTKVKGDDCKLYDYQKTFIRDESTFRIVNKARQLGFSFIMAGEGLVETLMDEESVILFISTSENAAKRVLDYCKQIYHSIPAGIRPKTFKNSQTEIQFLGKGRKPAGHLVSLPCNPMTCRGFNATRIYVDEAAHFKEEEKIFRAIQPSISRGGKMTVSSTPRGRGNVFYDIWANNKEYSKHLIPYTSCPDPMYIKRIEDMRATMDELSFAQEYQCQFREDAYAYFPEKILAPCVDDELGQYFTIKRQGAIHMGIDWAKKEDSTAVVVGEHIDNEKLFVVRRIEFYKRIPYEQQLSHIYEICRELEVEKIFCDQTGVGEKLYEDLVNNSGVHVEGINFTIATKELLITKLRQIFESEAIRIPRNKLLMTQLRSLERTYTEQGHVRFRHVSNEHDDAVWCYDDKTKILTDDGWKYFKNLKLSDNIAQLKNDELIFDKPKKIVSFNYNGDMIHFKNNGIDILVTPEHSCYVAISKGANQYRNHKLLKAEGLIGKHLRLKKNVKWNKKIEKNSEYYIRVPKAKNCDNREIKIKINDFMELLGYYLSEGYIDKYRTKVMIAQKKGTYKYEIIKKCLSKIYNFKEIKDGFVIYSKRIAKLFSRRLAYEKYIPKKYKNYPTKQLKILLNAMMLGDGSRNMYYSSSKKLAEDFSEIALKCGYGVNILKDDRIGRQALHGKTNYISYIVSMVTNKNNPRLNHHSKDQIQKIKYSGKVYCCESNTGIIMTMRNGFSAWCGNSLSMAASEFKKAGRDFEFKLGSERESVKMYDKDETEDMAKIRKLF